MSQPPSAPMGAAKKPIVYLGLPYHKDILPETMLCCSTHASDGSCAIIFPPPTKGSILPDVFNRIWCEARKMRKQIPITHFVMVHSDIRPDIHFVDVLVREQVGTGADIVSAVVPIKDRRGLTSTAVDSPAGPRRLTMKEVFRLPETFGLNDVKKTLLVPSWHGPLVVNTGCWVCDFTRPWVDKVHFEFQTAILEDKDGNPYPVRCGEDWIFSRDVQRLGGTILATRKVRLNHYGDDGAYTNAYSWGEWETDKEGSE